MTSLTQGLSKSVCRVMICYIPGCICYGSKNFGLGSLHDDCVGLAGAVPQFYSVAPNRVDYRFVDE